MSALYTFYLTRNERNMQLPEAWIQFF